MKIIYQGFFLDELSSLRLQKNSHNTLEKQISDLHVTFEFKPSVLFPEELLGEKAKFSIVGYANDGTNEGFEVEIPTKYVDFYKGSTVPHITLSVSNDGKPHNTQHLKFKPLDNPIEVCGAFGIFTSQKILYHL